MAAVYHTQKGVSTPFLCGFHKSDRVLSAICTAAPAKRPPSTACNLLLKNAAKMRRMIYDQIITIFKIIAVCVFNAQASPSGAFKRQNGLVQARWRGLAPTSLFFVQRNTRCASNAKSSWLFCKVCRRCAKVCGLCQKNKKAMKSFDFTASTVDIPMRWNPQAKQSRTVALLAALRAAALFEPLPSC